MTWLSRNSLSSKRRRKKTAWGLLSSSYTILTAVTDLVRPRLNFLPESMSRVVKLNIPRGGGPASACFDPTKHDLIRVTPTCLTFQWFEARSRGLMGAVWHTGPTPLIYPNWNLQALLRKYWCHMTRYPCVQQRAVEPQQKYYRKKIRLHDSHFHMLWLCSSVRGDVWRNEIQRATFSSN